MTAAFELHARLVADTFEVSRLPLSRVLLMNDSRFPWLLLVPERHGAVEIIDLAPADQVQLMAEIRLVSQAMKELFRPEKLNVAAIGNIVRQLHVHVIARNPGDAAWPGPVWGTQPAPPYELRDAVKRVHDLQAALRVGNPPS